MTNAVHIVNGLPKSIATGNGDLAETSFAMSNNVTSFTDITGFLFGNNVRTFRALVSTTFISTATLVDHFEIIGTHIIGNWRISVNTSGGDQLSIEFDITSSGQLQYKVGNYSPFTSGTLHFRAETLTV